MAKYLIFHDKTGRAVGFGEQTIQQRRLPKKPGVIEQQTVTSVSGQFTEVSSEIDQDAISSVRADSAKLRKFDRKS